MRMSDWHGRGTLIDRGTHRDSGIQEEDGDLRLAMMVPMMTVAIGVAFFQSTRMDQFPSWIVLGLTGPDHAHQVPSKRFDVGPWQTKQLKKAWSATFAMMASGVIVIVLDGGHLFHDPCLTTRLQRSHTCPICGAPVGNESNGIYYTDPSDSEDE